MSNELRAESFVSPSRTEIITLAVCQEDFKSSTSLNVPTGSLRSKSPRRTSRNHSHDMLTLASRLNLADLFTVYSLTSFIPASIAAQLTFGQILISGTFSGQLKFLKPLQCHKNKNTTFQEYEAQFPEAL